MSQDRTPNEENNQVKCFVDRESLSKSTNITGEIWIEVERHSFPERGWSDFPVIVLGWWLEGLTKLWLEEQDECKCFFMDGPYNFTVTRKMDHWSLQCFDRHHSPASLILSAQAHHRPILQNLLTAALEVIAECRHRGWETTDLNYLIAACERLTVELNRERA
jgi:hypothetical protein